jgi:hypothetical protein
MYPYNNPYEALALRSYSLDKIIQELRLADANGEVHRADRDNMRFVRTLIDKKSNVPTFGHPIIIGDVVYIDARSLVAATSSTGEYRIKDQGEYNFRVLRAALEFNWSYDEDFKDALVSASDLPLELYCKWFSEGITHRLGLDPETQAKLAVLAGFFYLGCVEAEQNEKVWHRNVAMVARVTRVPAQRILEWFPTQLQFNSIEELTMYISNHLDNPRLGKMNPALLFGILSSGWYTQHGSEVMGVALEMPVTWIACIFHAVGDRNLRKSRIGQLLQRVDKGDRSELFQRSILSLLRQ